MCDRACVCACMLESVPVHEFVHACAYVFHKEQRIIEVKTKILET